MRLCVVCPYEYYYYAITLTVSVWLEAFLIIIELSHKILWEEFRIKTNHKGRPRIAAFQYYSSKDHVEMCLLEGQAAG